MWDYRRTRSPQFCPLPSSPSWTVGKVLELKAKWVKPKNFWSFTRKQNFGAGLASHTVCQLIRHLFLFSFSRYYYSYYYLSLHLLSSTSLHPPLSICSHQHWKVEVGAVSGLASTACLSPILCHFGCNFALPSCCDVMQSCSEQLTFIKFVFIAEIDPHSNDVQDVVKNYIE